MTADEVASITVVISGSTKVGSVTSFAKLANVSAPVLSVTLKEASHDIGSTISAIKIAANAIRIGQERSSRARRSAGAARARVMGRPMRRSVPLPLAGRGGGGGGCEAQR